MPMAGDAAQRLPEAHYTVRIAPALRALWHARGALADNAGNATGGEADPVATVADDATLVTEHYGTETVLSCAGAPEADRVCGFDASVAAEPKQAFTVPKPKAERLSLRRDGLAPKRFSGWPILRCDRALEVPAPDGRQHTAHEAVELYLADDGRVIARLVIEVPETAPARPLHRLRTLRSAADLSALFASACPDDAFRVGALHSGPAVPRSAASAMPPRPTVPLRPCVEKEPT